ncbi:MAG TPA: 3-hydroxyacyl-CoA dehydrogenase NAD-binding domain-containing protein, partial [Thermoanaerobaculia bacterium]|nr:3-hydroxyacyl-CoA dehydrogenase NAD-binding domain-containing protein [Thermoanaerobaculia bacterium]
DPAEAAAGSRLGQALFTAWEELPFPTVAAIDGLCLGGGTELATASTYRVVSDSPEVAIGLPEVKLGILPAWGGTTRLPRLLALPDALAWILTGRNVDGRKALRQGFADALMPSAGFLRYVRDFAREHRGTTRAAGKSGGFDVKEMLLEKNPLGRRFVLEQARKKTLAETKGKYPAPLAAIDVVRVGLEDGRAAGFEAEARAFGELATSGVSKNLIHVFHLTEAAKKQQGVPGGEARKVGAVAVIGAGTMGGGIAQLVAQQAEVPVVMKDIAAEPLAGGMATAGVLFDKLEERRKLTAAEAKRKLALIQPTLDYDGFGRIDLVIEAVVEKLPVKQKVLAEIGERVPAETVLASNTSSLAIDDIAADTTRPERVVGMHFFNPVHKMPLVEVVVGARSAPEAINTVFAFARRLGKTPVLVGETPGFLVNRLLTFYSVEALWLLDEGYRVEDIDEAMADWGMPIGPLALTDEVGIDVATEVAGVLNAAYADRLPVPAWQGGFAAAGYLGKKNGRGIYRYDGRQRGEVNRDVYGVLGLEPTVEEPDPRYLQERMVLRMIDEAARCLEEEVVASAGETDLAMIFGTGFPPFRGGPCRWADRQGLDWVTETLERFASAVGERYRPSDALRRTKEAGGFYARFGMIAEGKESAERAAEPVDAE